MYPMLPVSLDCPFLTVTSGFSYVYSVYINLNIKVSVFNGFNNVDEWMKLKLSITTKTSESNKIWIQVVYTGEHNISIT